MKEDGRRKRISVIVLVVPIFDVVSFNVIITSINLTYTVIVTIYDGKMHSYMCINITNSIY